MAPCIVLKCCLAFLNVMKAVLSLMEKIYVLNKLCSGVSYSAIWL